jgi:8-oxo-dGTP diphosphatase
MREWLVAGALVEIDGALLLVRNERRGGHSDWTTPGGVIDADDQSLLDGLTREVYEETGLRVTAWEGPLYEVNAVARDMD